MNTTEPPTTHKKSWHSRILRWSSEIVPLHLIVDAAGRIHFVETGYTTPWGLRARLWWVEHFAGAHIMGEH